MINQSEVKLFKNLTIKEVNIIFSLLYDLSQANNYLTGYLPNGQIYDVVEENNQLKLYQGTYADYKLPVTGAFLK